MQLHHMAVVADLTSPWAYLVHGWRLRLAGWLHPYRLEEYYMRGAARSAGRSTAAEDGAGSISMLFQRWHEPKRSRAYVGLEVEAPGSELVMH